MALEAAIKIIDTKPGFTYAGFWQRAKAAAIDAVILLCLQVALFGGYNYLLEQFFKDDFKSLGLGLLIIQCLLYSIPAVLLFLVGLPWLYFAVGESGKWQATPGKRLIGLQVVDLQGRPFSFVRASLKVALQSSVWIIIFCFLALDLGSNADLSTALITLYFGLFTWFAHEIPNQSIPAVILAYACCYLLLLFTEQKQTLFDRLTGRLVIVARPQARGEKRPKLRNET